MDKTPEQLAAIEKSRAETREKYGLDKLVEALQIFLKYGNPTFPIQAEHDEIYLHGIKFEDVKMEDVNRLEELHFEYDEDTEGWRSSAWG